MKLAIALISLALATGSVFAADDTKAAAPKKAPTAAQKAQQDKMKACNAKATDKKGAERKAFMKECLSGGNAAPSACEGKAAEKKLTGAAKSSFVKKCEADAKAAPAAAAPAAAPAAPAPAAPAAAPAPAAK